MQEHQNGRRGGLPTPFQTWQQGERIPVHRGAFVPDLYTLDLSPWARFGQNGAFVNLADQEEDDGYVVEIAPGGKTEVQRHLFEAVIYVVNGRGATSFWQEDGRKQTVEWQRGSVFAPPLNCHYQHFNLDGHQTVRLFAVTNAPIVMNLFGDPNFVFDCPYAFSARYDASDAYFTDAGRSIGKRDWQTNFIPDVRGFKLIDWLERGAGQTMNFRLGNNTQMAAHISEFPVGHYKKAHRHGVGAHVIILTGQGYSLLWFEETQKWDRVEWKDGTVLSPREWEYHQHFNTGPVPARYLAFRFGVPGIARLHGNAGWNTEDELNGIDYELENPAIYETFTRECAAHGAEVRITRPQYAAR